MSIPEADMLRILSSVILKYPALGLNGKPEGFSTAQALARWTTTFSIATFTTSLRVDETRPGLTVSY